MILGADVNRKQSESYLDDYCIGAPKSRMSA
jgi:hypothetical protein